MAFYWIGKRVERHATNGLRSQISLRTTMLRTTASADGTYALPTDPPRVLFIQLLYNWHKTLHNSAPKEAGWNKSGHQHNLKLLIQKKKKKSLSAKCVTSLSLHKRPLIKLLFSVFLASDLLWSCDDIVGSHCCSRKLLKSK